VLAAAGVGACAILLTIGGAGSAAAASGQVNSIRDLKSVWLTSLTGFQGGQEVVWQHVMIVRKVKGSAAAAWEGWRDCAAHPRECKAGKASGGGWSAPSQVLLAMDATGVVHGIGATATMMFTPGKEGMSAVMLSKGQQADRAASGEPTTVTQRMTTPKGAGFSSNDFAVTGPSYSICPSGTLGADGEFTYTP
jgi:hypothetical protein